MTKKRTLFFGLGTFGLILAVTTGLIVMAQYNRGKRTEREATFRERFAELDQTISSEAQEAVARLPLLYKEREQPFDSVARATIREITGKRKIYGVQPSLIFAEMVFNKDFDWDSTPLILVDHEINKKRLGVESIDSLATVKQVTSSAEFAQALDEARKKPENEITKRDSELFVINKKVHDARNRFASLLYFVPPTQDQLRSETKDYQDWHLITDAESVGHDPVPARSIKQHFKDLEKSWVARDSAGILAAVQGMRADMKELSPVPLLSDEKIDLELQFNAVKPFNYASWTFLIASFLGVFGLAFKKRYFAIGCWAVAVIGVLLMIWGGWVRYELGFGVVITNLYESMVSVAIGAVIAGFIVDLVRKSRWNTMIGAFVGFVVLQIVDLESVKYADGIGGTIAVLSNNFWVHIHVPIVMMSYAFFSVAFLMSCVGLPWSLFADRKAKDPAFRSMMKSADVSVNLGTIFIFAGLILGGIWAAESWGRFWGWDPKETWALILFLYYMVMVHGRFTSWLTPFWSNWMLFNGGNMLLWTYYGTNELLSGLHSYANSAGGDGFWENFIHERNRWFVYTTGVMAVISLATLVFYFVSGGEKSRLGAAAGGDDEIETDENPDHKILTELN